jgi:ABC-type cobalamin transport system permease subunit
MRRITILLGGLLLIVVALPLLPGPGWLTIARVLTVLEREFVWVHRLLNRLESAVNQPVARSHGLDRHTAVLPRSR